MKIYVYLCVISNENKDVLCHSYYANPVALDNTTVAML